MSQDSKKRKREEGDEEKERLEAKISSIESLKEDNRLRLKTAKKESNKPEISFLKEEMMKLQKALKLVKQDMKKNLSHLHYNQLIAIFEKVASELTQYDDDFDFSRQSTSTSIIELGSKKGKKECCWTQKKVSFLAFHLLRMFGESVECTTDTSDEDRDELENYDEE